VTAFKAHALSVPGIQRRVMHMSFPARLNVTKNSLQTKHTLCTGVGHPRTTTMYNATLPRMIISSRALKSKHKLLQALDGIDVRRPRRCQLARGAVRKRPCIAQSSAVTGTISHDVAAALEVGHYVVDEGVDLGLVLNHTSVSLKDTHTLPRGRDVPCKDSNSADRSRTQTR